MAVFNNDLAKILEILTLGSYEPGQAGSKGEEQKAEC